VLTLNPQYAGIMNHTRFGENGQPFMGAMKATIRPLLAFCHQAAALSSGSILSILQGLRLQPIADGFLMSELIHASIWRRLAVL
jgi:hypothetical protein